MRDATAPSFSLLVRVSADRATRGYTAVRWDDEGVAPVSTPLIDGGRVVGLLTTRETASLVGAGAPSSGCATAPQATQPVMAGGAHLTLVPN
jgi:predicted Zn-dependent protease